MPVRSGRCTNFANCPVADSKQVVEVADGSELVCPQCGRQLAETLKEKSRSPLLPVGAGLLLLLIGVAAWYMFAGRKTAAPPATVGGSPGGQSPATASAVNAAVILRLHGSNTIGGKLVPDLAAAFMKQQGAQNVRTAAGPKPDEVNVEGVLPGDPAPKVIEIQAHGSATAFTDLVTGTADIGMSSRRIKPEEVTAAHALGDLTSPASEHILGLDGVAVIVSRSNSVPSLSKDQLAQIFSGEVTTWKQVLAPGGAIKIYRRDDNSGTADTFKTLVLGGRAFAPGAVALEDSRELGDRVASDADAIGFVALPFIGRARAVAISETGATAMLPTRLTIAAEDYPLSRRLYLYTPANSRNPLAEKFIDFAIGSAGQTIVADNGFVSQTVAAIAPDGARGGPSEYQKLTAGAERLSLNFRFRTGSSDLDNKALVDLDRVVAFVGDLHYTGADVFLFGFADSTGTRDANLVLSKGRARVVASQFEQRGLKPAVSTGYGSDLPVAANDSIEGREKNRRVEIWVRKK